ncbi:TPA: hypothetical protein N2D99_002044 [Clostridium botulinum]|nr:hypothetical protein [Clostridium botulinum]
MAEITFLKKKELEQILGEALTNIKKSPTICSIVINEDNNDEYVQIEYNGILDRQPLEDLFDILEKELKIKIQRYDVMEVGDYGDGFVFLNKVTL